MDDYIINELNNIKYRFSVVVSELKKRNGIIDTQILDLIDDINTLSVEI